MKAIVYTNVGCPRCEIIKEKLEQKGIKYEEVSDFDRDWLAGLGFSILPVVEHDGVLMDFATANNWINER